MWIGAKGTSDNKWVRELEQVPQHPQRSPEWFEQRKYMLTSSNAGAALGLVKQKSPLKLMFEYCGVGAKFTGNVFTEWGQTWEDPAIEVYASANNYRNYDFGLLPYTWKERPATYTDNEGNILDLSFLGGSVDGVCLSLDSPNEKPWVLEIKCPYRRNIKYGYCPEYYYPQVQLNMLITDLDMADFIEYDPRTEKMNVVRYYRDELWLKENLPKLAKFWQDVEYWRSNGIENHPKYNRYKKKPAPSAPAAPSAALSGTTQSVPASSATAPGTSVDEAEKISGFQIRNGH